MRCKVSRLPGEYLEMICLVVHGECKRTKTRLLSNKWERSMELSNINVTLAKKNYREVNVTKLI